MTNKSHDSDGDNEQTVKTLTTPEKDRLFRILNEQSEQLQQLKQGMFGDKQLGVRGLIEDMTYVKNWIQTYKVKVAFLAGIFAAVGFAIKSAWEWIVNHNK